MNGRPSTAVGAAVFASLSASLLAQFPANDSFADRLDLNSSMPFAASIDATGSTFEALEPGDLPCSEHGSVWWEWTAPADGWIEFEAHTGEARAGVAVFVGGSLGELDLPRLNGARYGATTGRGRVRFPARQDTSYQIAVRPSVAGVVQLIARSIPPPVINDSFAQRAPLGGPLPVTADFTVLGATPDSADPPILGASASRSYWWQWTAPAAGLYEITFQTDDPGSRLGVFRGTALGALSTIGASTVDGLMAPAPIYAAAAAGEPLQILVDAPDGPVTLGVRSLSPPPNDMPDGASLLTGPLPVTATGTTALATAPPEEPGWRSDWPHPSVWWRWTPTSDESITAKARDHVQVFSGEDPAALSPIANGEGGEVTFMATADVTVWFRVTHVLGQAPVELSLRRINAPPLPLEGSHVDGAVAYSGTPVSVEWRPPVSGTFLFSVDDQARIALSGSGFVVPAQPGPVVQEVAAGDVLTVTFSDALMPAGGDLRWWIDHVTDPVSLGNDNFVAATPLPGTLRDAAFVSLSRATLEEGEPATSHLRTVWWRWVAPSTGAVDVEIGRQNAAGAVEVFSGAVLATLDELSRADFEKGGRASLHVTAGQTYWIRLATSGGGPCWLCLRPGAAAVHVTPDSALDLGTGWLSRTRASALALDSSPALWWKWSAPADGHVVISARPLGAPTAGSSGLLYSLFREASPGVPHSFPDAPPDEHPTLKRYPVRSGETCWIAAQSGAVPAYIELEIVPATAQTPPNDAFANRSSIEFESVGELFRSPTIRSTHFRWDPTGHLEWATLEPGEPEYIDSPPPTDAPLLRRSTWWTFIAPTDGAFQIRPGPEDEEPRMMAVFTGTALDNLQLVTRRYGSTPINLPVRAGIRYYLAAATADPVSQFEFQLEGPIHDGSYFDWITSFSFDSLADDAPTVNPSGDGFPNVLKWVLGLDPTKNSSASGDDPNRAHAPVLTETETSIELRFRRSPTVSGSLVHLWGQSSSDLVNWGGGSALEPASLGGGYFAIRAPKSPAPVFLRLLLRVESASPGGQP